jgi:hypothetical protein
VTRVRPRLSVVVAVGRGGEPRDYVGRLVRMLSSLDRTAMTMDGPPLEAVVVDWNAAPEQPVLSNVLTPFSNILVRVVVVPPELHQRAARGSGRPFLEGAAKNVGVVRASSERVLVTNADVILRSDLVGFCVRAPLGNHTFVRADRYDFRARTLDSSPKQPEERTFMAHIRHGSTPAEHIHIGVEPTIAPRDWPRSRRLRGEFGSSVIWGPRGGLRNHFLRGAHTNAAGDFLCVSKAVFRAVGGWTEDPNIWHHSDALLVAQLLGANLRQVIYAKPGAVLHEDHPRLTEEERGGGSARWPDFLESIQSILNRRSSAVMTTSAPLGLEHDDLVEYTIS